MLGSRAPWIPPSAIEPPLRAGSPSAPLPRPRARQLVLRGVLAADLGARRGRSLAPEEEVVQRAHGIRDVEAAGIIRIGGVDARELRVPEEEMAERRDGIRDVELAVQVGVAA